MWILAEQSKPMEIKTEVMEPFVKWALEIYASQPMLGYWMVLVVIDVAMGLCAAFMSSRLSSTVSQKGMTKKVAMMLLIGFSAVLEQMGSGGIPLTKMAAGFFCVVEGVSIIENAARCGIPIPQSLIDRLSKLKQEVGLNVSTGPIPVQIQKTEHVDVHIDSSNSATVSERRPDSVVIVNVKPKESSL